MSAITIDLLTQAVMPGGSSCLTSVTELEPAAGPHASVAPAKFASPDTRDKKGTYAYEHRYLDGGARTAVLIDSKQSQLNRCEAALAQAVTDGHPVLSRMPRVVVSYDRDGFVEEYSDLTLPHRVFDGHIRAGTADGQPVTQLDAYRAIRNATPANARALLDASPVSLIFGSWDSSRSARQGRWRSALTGEIVGFCADDRPASKGGARVDPVGMQVQLGEADLKALAEAAAVRAVGQELQEDDGRGLVGEGEGQAGVGVDAGLGGIPPSLEALAGVACQPIIRSHVLSFATLRQVRFGARPDGDAACRALLAALALNALARSDAELYLRAIFGRRLMFLAGVIIFAVTSATAGLAQDPAMLIGSRAVQGVGAALMMPATLSIITHAFPAAERGKAIGTWAGVSALALSIGPVVGGFLTEYVSWRAIFFINLPVAVGAVIATVFAVRESRDETVDRRVDYPGVIALTLSLTAIVLALIEGNSWGWGSASVLSLLIGGAIGLAAFVAIELRVAAPMVEFGLFKTRQFIGSNLVAFIITFAMMGTFFFMAIYMQDILGYGALEAGIRFLPTTMVIAVVAPIAGRLADRVGPATPMSAGLAVLAVSMFMFAGIDTATTYSGLLVPFILMGLGIALVMSPMSTAAMNAVSVQKSGVASGVLQMSRMIGASVGIAATGAIFQSQLGSGFDPAALATAPDQARAVFVDALSSAMLLAAIVVVAGLVVSLTLVRGARSKRIDSHDAAEESAAAVPEATVAEDVVPAGAR